MNGEGAEREACGRVFRTRFHMPNHARDNPHPPRSKLGKFKNFHTHVGVDFLRISQFVNFVSCGISEILRISRFRDFEDSEISRNLKFLAVPVLCRDNVIRGSGARGARARGRVFRTRFRTSNHARNAPRSLRNKFGKIENLRFRNSEILRILKFQDFLRYYSAVMNGEGAEREACGRVFRTRFRMPNHARDTPPAQEQAWEMRKFPHARWSRFFADFAICEFCEFGIPRF